MSDYKVRLHEEHTQLSMRLDKLKEFILSPAYNSLPTIDQTDLTEQLGHMEGYFSVIKRRVSRLCN